MLGAKLEVFEFGYLVRLRNDVRTRTERGFIRDKNSVKKTIWQSVIRTYIWMLHPFSKFRNECKSCFAGHLILFWHNSKFKLTLNYCAGCWSDMKGWTEVLGRTKTTIPYKLEYSNSNGCSRSNGIELKLLRASRKLIDSLIEYATSHQALTMKCYQRFWSGLGSKSENRLIRFDRFNP